MKNVIFPFVLVFLYGCGNAPFTTAMAGAAGEPDDGGTGTGGASASGGAQGATGGRGAGGAETGGRVNSTGGVAATGGVVGTGGASTGGTASTGGVTTATGGAPAVDACALVTHTNGLGQTWQDCVPVNTYDLNQAMKACEAAGAAHCIDNGSVCGGTYVVCGYDAPYNSIYGGCWGYYGDFIAGSVDSVALGGGGSCPNANSSTSRPWG